MAGYDEKFLKGITLPLPTFSPLLDQNVLRREELAGEFRADYINYTVVTDKVRRAPIFAALNIDQHKKQKTSYSGNWRIDRRVGADAQLDNAYYKGDDNPYDRGHLAPRASAGWGDKQRIAQRSADETFYYSNASPQHCNFNQDEWRELEDWVLDLKLDLDGKITSFTGPVYGDFARTILPRGRPAAFIPSAFFKVVCFVNAQTLALDVRAFLMFQDREAEKDLAGRKVFNYQIYQVTVKEIEELTGLQFQDEVYEKNPLLYDEDRAAASRLRIDHFPERIEVDSPEEIVAADTTRDFVADDEVDVYIAAAMVNPSGPERANEWVSILNLTGSEVDLSTWELRDNRGHAKKLSGTLQPGAAASVGDLSPVILYNVGGIIELWDRDRRVDRVDYTENEAEAQDVPIIFAWRTDW